MAEKRESKKDEEVGPRSFSVFVRELAEGEAESELSFQLQQLCKRLQEDAVTRMDDSRGSLTLKLKLVAEPAGHVGITYEVAVKEPKRRTSHALMYLDKNGNLQTQNPRQQKLPLREVSAAQRAADVAEPDDAWVAREV